MTDNEPRTPEQTIREATERIERIALSEPTNERDEALRESLAVLVDALADLRAEAVKLEKRRVVARSDAEGYKSLYHEARAELAAARELVALYRAFAQREYEALAAAPTSPAEAPQAEPASEQIGYVDLGTLGSVPMYVREAASTAEPDTETRDA